MQIIVPTLDIFSELFTVNSNIATTVITTVNEVEIDDSFDIIVVLPDHQLTARFQGFEELAKELFLVSDVEDGVTTVDHVIEVVRVLHGQSILNVELDPVLHSRLHLRPVVLGNANHVGGQVNAMNIYSIVPGHVEC